MLTVTTGTPATARRVSQQVLAVARAHGSNPGLGRHAAALVRYAPPKLPGAAWIVPVFGTIVFAYGGWPFVRAPCARSRTGCPA